MDCILYVYLKYVSDRVSSIAQNNVGMEIIYNAGCLENCIQNVEEM